MKVESCCLNIYEYCPGSEEPYALHQDYRGKFYYLLRL